MNEKAGAQISRKAFLQSATILLALIILAGVLTLIIPAGRYVRSIENGRETIDPQSFQIVSSPDYPFWRWFTAPVEVLWGSDGLIIITIILFILIVGISFAVLDKTGILRAVVDSLVRRYGARKYLLLALISLFFMLLGSSFGIFEEVVPLVPLMVALSYSLGWDSLVGLGMSILATNMGFSAAILNPFTLGVAQGIAELPPFSGALLRIPIFLAIYAVLIFFLTRYARKIEQDPEKSPVFELDRPGREKSIGLESRVENSRPLGRSIAWFLGSTVLILVVLIGGPFVPVISGYALPIVGLLFLIGGIGAGILSGTDRKAISSAVREGFSGILPGIPLILMAVSVKHIVATGEILDTILHAASQVFAGSSPFLSIVMIFGLTLVMEFFVASGSAKAFLMIPILVPLADLIGVTRQATIQAYIFGDGFSNMLYPTNPVLLISLGLTVVSFPVWLRWSLKLWLGVLLIAITFLGIAVAIGYGPY
jgi:uncharacterized ion transporter superfamily protein YfcC